MKTIKTAKEIEKSFKTEFIALLKKYNATFEVDDHYQGYAECGRDLRAEISIPAIYDGDNGLINEYAIFDLGCYLN